LKIVHLQALAIVLRLGMEMMMVVVVMTAVVFVGVPLAAMFDPQPVPAMSDYRKVVSA